MSYSLTLNNKLKMPSLGLGTWKAEKGKVGEAVDYALTQAGYKHIDCAAIYKNEPEIGQVFHQVFSTGVIKRQDIFITSKLWNTEHSPERVEKACRETLKDLQLDYLDLYLIHWGIAFPSDAGSEPLGDDGLVKTAPISTQDTWQAMEKLVEKGLVKSIGVANFTTAMLVDLLSHAKIKPVVNQIEIHPYNSQAEVVKYCQKQNIQVTAYSPLGSFGDLGEKPISDPVIKQISLDHQKSPAQILIRWSLQRGLIAIPKSTQLNRVAENFLVDDFELSGLEMEKINSLNKNHRFVDPVKWWGLPYFK